MYAHRHSMAEMSPGMEMKTLGCGHTYNLSCMEQWYPATSNFEEHCPWLRGWRWLINLAQLSQQMAGSSQKVASRSTVS